MMPRRKHILAFCLLALLLLLVAGLVEFAQYHSPPKESISATSPPKESISTTAMGQGKGDPYTLAQTAAGAGKAEEAARLFCQLDPGYKDARMMCDIMTKEAIKELQKNEDRFQEGVKAFNEGRYDDAKQKFQNVRTGPRVEEAREYLNVINAKSVINATTAQTRAQELTRLGQSQIDGGDYANAALTFRLAVDLDPSNPAAQDGLRKAEKAKRTEEDIMKRRR